MRAHDEHAIHSSVMSDWGTPKPLFQALDEEFDFLIDVAATRRNRKCEVYFGPDQQIAKWRDGLTVSWSETVRELVAISDRTIKNPAVFMNPPFSRDDKIPILPWIRKAYEASRSAMTVVALLPYAPQTEWFRWYVCGQASPNLTRFHAAMEERRIPFRVDFDATPEMIAAINAKRRAQNKAEIEETWSAGVNTCVIVWKPSTLYVGPWQPAVRTWGYRMAA